MKSVGEAMAIGRNFKESLQKALISLETGFSGLDKIFNLNTKQLEKKLKENIPNKILLVGEAFRKKINIDKIHKLSKIDPHTSFAVSCWPYRLSVSVSQLRPARLTQPGHQI